MSLTSLVVEGESTAYLKVDKQRLDQTALDEVITH